MHACRGCFIIKKLLARIMIHSLLHNLCKLYSEMLSSLKLWMSSPFLSCIRSSKLRLRKTHSYAVSCKNFCDLEATSSFLAKLSFFPFLLHIFFHLSKIKSLNGTKLLLNTYKLNFTLRLNCCCNMYSLPQLFLQRHYS